MRNSETLSYSGIYKERLTSPLSCNIERETEIYSIPNFLDKDENFIPRETLVSVYGDNYDLVQLNIQNTEKEAMNYFSITLDELKIKYDEFNTNINSHFNRVTNKITKAFGLNNPSEDSKDSQRNSLIQKHSNEYIEQINKIINMHQQIFSHLKDSISIFFNFLDITKFLNKQKPIKEFLNKEFDNIIQNWLFLKINLENYNFAKAINKSKLDPDFKNFIFKICKDKSFIMDISSGIEYMEKSKKKFEDLTEEVQSKINSNMKNNKKIMEDNHNNLVKLSMNNIFSVDTFFDNKIKYKKLHYLKLDNTTFCQRRNEVNNFLENLPALENLIINSSSNFEINILKNLSKSLLKLSLTKNGFVDYDFNNIMSNYLVKSESIRKNLQILSFSNNNLSNIDIAQIVYQPKQRFDSLKELDFEKNKIYKFNILPEFFVELKCINCCSNCFTKSYFEQYNNILTLLSGNIYLSKFNLAKIYFYSLEKKLINPSFSLSYLNLSYIPKILSHAYISNIIINDSILINIKRLDLSHNNLNCDTILKFFENNKGFLSLKTLNLSYNILDDSFFENFLNLKLNNLFNKLKCINLDSNKFGTYIMHDKNIDSQRISDILFQKNNNEKEILRLRLLYKFILENKNLFEITLTKNPLKNNYLVKKIEDYLNSFNFNNYVKKDENKNIEINCLYSFLWKIKNDFYGENKNNEARNKFNLKFDCINSNNIDSYEFDFTKKFIIFKNKKI